MKDKLKEKDRIISRLQTELLEKDKPLKEKTLMAQKLEEKIGVIERKHE